MSIAAYAIAGVLITIVIILFIIWKFMEADSECEKYRKLLANGGGG